MGNGWLMFSSLREPPCSLLCRGVSTSCDPEAAARSDEGDLLLLNAPSLGFAEELLKLLGHIQH